YIGVTSGGEMAQLKSYAPPLVAGTVVWSAVCAAWLGLAYPAVATNVAGGSLHLSLRLSRRQRLRLFVAFLLGAEIWIAATLAILLVARDETGDLQPISFLATTLSFWAQICFIAVSAAAYGQLQHRSSAKLLETFD